MNFLLKDLEFHIDDHYLELAEQLIQDQMISEPIELERNLWVLHTLGAPMYEIEIQISPSKVKAYTCDCDEFRKYGMCEHVAAGLLLVREKQKSKAAKKKIKKKVKSGPKKLTTATILDHVSLEELKEFVKSYAKENKGFSIALKTRFAPNISLPNNLEKYAHLLDSTINSIKRQALRFSKKASAPILKVSEEILLHAEDGLLTQNYAESFAICQSLFTKVLPLIPKAEDKSDFNGIIQQNFNLLKKLTAQALAPQLQEKLWEYLSEAAFSPTSRLAGFDQPFLEQMLAYTTDKPDWSAEAEALVDQALDDPQLGDHYRIHLLLARMNLLDRHQKTDLLQAIIQNNLSKPEVLQLALQKSVETKDWKRSKQLAEIGLEGPDENKAFEEVLLKVAVETKDRRAIKKWAYSRFLADYDFQYVQILKEQFARSWEKVRATLIEKLQKQLFSIEQRDALARLLAEEQLLDQLMAYLKRIRSFDLLPRYDQLLFAPFPKQIQQLYQDLCTEHLNTHLGRQPSIRIRKLLEHLNETGQSPFMQQLKRNLEKQFSDRPSLMDELKELN
ncbi:MAG: hypothetical protein AAF985_21225 [Bacteroidota bacterium]